MHSLVCVSHLEASLRFIGITDLLATKLTHRQIGGSTTCAFKSVLEQAVVVFSSQDLPRSRFQDSRSETIDFGAWY